MCQARTPTIKPGVEVAETELKTRQLREPSDALADLGEEGVGHLLRIRLRIEMGGNPPRQCPSRRGV